MGTIKDAPGYSPMTGPGYSPLFGMSSDTFELSPENSSQFLPMEVSRAETRNWSASALSAASPFSSASPSAFPYPRREMSTGGFSYSSLPRQGLRARIVSVESIDGQVAEFQLTCGRRRRRGVGMPEPDVSMHCADVCNLMKGIKHACHLKPSKTLKEEMLKGAVVYGDTGLVEVDKLEELGFTAEDLCRVIYDEHINEMTPNLIRHLHIEEHGGLNRIESVWIPNNEKYFWFYYLLISVAFNMTFLLVMNWTIFKTYMAHLESGFLHDLDKIKGFEDLMNATTKLELSGDNSSLTSSAVENSMQLAIVFNEIHDGTLARLLLNIATLIASWEVLWIFVKMIYSLRLFFLFVADSSEFRAYRAANLFFKDLLPQFSTFSAIKFMARVHPSLLYNRYMYNIKESSWRGTYAGRIATIVLFAIENLICVTVGVMAFGIKLLAVGLRLINPAYSWSFRMCSVISLMIQCMGCVQMEKVLAKAT